MPVPPSALQGAVSDDSESEAADPEAEVQEEVSDPEDGPEEDDIEALARAALKPGETILGEGVGPAEVESRGVCLAPRLLQKVEELEYKVPPGAKRVPWVDTMMIDGQTKLPKGMSAKAGVKLEAEFIMLAGDAVKEAYRRLKVMKVPLSRPPDFYAEMLKTDKQMYMIRQRAAEELRRIKIVETRKKHQAAKKFTKKAKTKKLEARAAEKTGLLNDISEWRAEKKKNGKDDEGRGLEEILDDKKRRDKHGNLVKSKKREFYDQKYGHGGKKKYKKQNTKDSTDDFSRSPWAKGGGKGKAGGKGKGKSGGKSKGGGRGKKQKK